MTAIDIHGHIGGWPDFFVPEPGSDWLLAVSAEAGIVATGVSHLFAVGVDPSRGNELALAEAERHGGRLGVWLVASPHRPESAALLDRQLSRPHVWGLKLHPDVHECPVTDPRYEPLFGLAAERGAPVLCHAQTRSPWSDPAMLAEVSRRHPGVTLLMGHAGLWPDGFDNAARLAVAHDGLFLEICGSRLTTRWLKRMVAIAGAEKVLFGSDAVFLDPRTGLGKVLYADLRDDERALVLAGNAMRILGDRYRGGIR